jgi:alpha-amylase/alpha-mannosidase (GH57 family)
MQGQLNVSLLLQWHLPFFRDANGKYILPWGSLHILRDYHSLITILQKYPDLSVAICLPPSTYLQIKEYAQRDARDHFWDFAEKDPGYMPTEKKKTLLRYFFTLERVEDIERFAGFSRLYDKYMRLRQESELEKIVDAFSEQEYRDLQVWFFLAWLGPQTLKREPFKGLQTSAGAFSEADKATLFSAVKKLFEEVFLFLHTFAQKPHRELLLVPYYHPLLPLLIDSKVAQSEAGDSENAPEFAYPEDADWHVRQARNYYRAEFGQQDWGMCLPEGGVSDATMALLAKYKLGYTIVDERILRLQTGGHYDPVNTVYDLHAFKVRRQAGIPFFIADAELDEKLNIVYPGYSTGEAIQDLRAYLIELRNRLIAAGKNLNNTGVTMVLRSETLWRKYSDNGFAFFSDLCAFLDAEESIRCVSPRHRLKHNGDIRLIDTLPANTKYGDHFRLWIGQAEDNLAWQYLALTRDFLTREIALGGYKKSLIARAWEHIYTAQSSDFWWWFGEENYHRHEMDFDKLFRGHLIKVYELLGFTVPEILFQPIKWHHFRPTRSVQPFAQIRPTIDGYPDPADEWRDAVSYDCAERESIFQDAQVFKRIAIGFDEQDLFFRIDFLQQLHPQAEIVISVYTHVKTTIVVSPLRGVVTYIYPRANAPEVKEIEYLQSRFAMAEVLELQFPLTKLDLPQSGRIQMQFALKLRRRELGRFPYLSLVELELPTLTGANG